MSDYVPWCPVCRVQVLTEGNTTVTDGQMGFYETFAAHGGCDGEGKRVKDADYGFVTDDGRTVPEWEYFQTGESS